MKKFKAIISSALAVAAAVCLCAATTTGTIAYTKKDYTFIMPGDVDSSKNVDINDASLIQMYLAKIDPVDEEILKLADYDGNGSANIDDVTSIQMMLAKYKSYKCVITPDEDYLTKSNSKFDFNRIPKKSEIEVEELINESNLVLGAKNDYSTQIAFITSKEQLFALLKSYSPDFDDEFFEQYALIVCLANEPYSKTERYLTAVGVSDNVLYVELFVTEYMMEKEEAPQNWHLFYQVNKSDVSNVKEIKTSINYGYLEEPFTTAAALQISTT